MRWKKSRQSAQDLEGISESNAINRSQKKGKSEKSPDEEDTQSNRPIHHRLPVLRELADEKRAPCGLGMNVRNANPNIICSGNCAFETVRKTLDTGGTNIYIPLLQRRYCWGRQVLSKFLKDVRAVSSANGDVSYRCARPHSFGRILTATREGRILLIDGQQRITTICLLLASLREALALSCEKEREDEKSGKGDKNEEKERLQNARKDAAHLQSKINNILFHSPVKRREAACAPSVVTVEAKGKPNGRVQEEDPVIPLPITISATISTKRRSSCNKHVKPRRRPRLTPSLDDRPAFMASVIPLKRAKGLALLKEIFLQRNRSSTNSANDLVSAPDSFHLHSATCTPSSSPHSIAVSKDRVSAAKAFFLSSILAIVEKEGGGSAVAVRLCRGIFFGLLNNCKILRFETQEEDLFCVYERLAFRAHALSYMHNPAPGMQLAEADLVKNFLLSFFVNEEDCIAAYTNLWIPMERIVVKSTTTGNIAASAEHDTKVSSAASSSPSSSSSSSSSSSKLKTAKKRRKAVAADDAAVGNRLDLLVNAYLAEKVRDDMDDGNAKENSNSPDREASSLSKNRMQQQKKAPSSHGGAVHFYQKSFPTYIALRRHVESLLQAENVNITAATPEHQQSNHTGDANGGGHKQKNRDIHSKAAEIKRECESVITDFDHHMLLKTVYAMRTQRVKRNQELQRMTAQVDDLIRRRIPITQRVRAYWAVVHTRGVISFLYDELRERENVG
eukprot:jgi/Bigna1/72140/fgenesh1_pg.18_\